LADAPLHALAGIGHPQRFFDLLAGQGLAIIPHAFPDHHAFRPEDLPAGRVVMTEKDAVKIAPLVRERGLTDCWFLAVDAELEPGLKEHLLFLLNKDRGRNHGPQVA
jgi:tetraacyldisaccharide 4'-kinase